MATPTSKETAAKIASPKTSAPKEARSAKAAVKKTKVTKPSTETKTQTKTGTKASKTNGRAAHTSGISEEDIAKRAFEIWQEEGCPSDRGDSNWLQAERELRAKLVSQ